MHVQCFARVIIIALRTCSNSSMPEHDRSSATPPAALPAFGLAIREDGERDRVQFLAQLHHFRLRICRRRRRRRASAARSSGRFALRANAWIADNVALPLERSWQSIRIPQDHVFSAHAPCQSRQRAPRGGARQFPAGGPVFCGSDRNASSACPGEKGERATGGRENGGGAQQKTRFCWGLSVDGSVGPIVLDSRQFGRVV